LREKAEEKTQKKNPFPYEPITPDILVEDETGYKFELGGVKFEVISLPGAEGINSAGLWMPEEKILFTGGGSVGPDFPMWPNLGTVRSDRNRILTEYIDTINTIIALEPEMLLTGQNDIFTDKDDIMKKLVLLRDAAQCTLTLGTHRKQETATMSLATGSIVHREVIELDASPAQVRRFIMTPQRILDYYPSPVHGNS
jgi:glyoxylase-like metal-dependent hydrolase (beta-lactamase superfamily II)